MEKLTIEQMQKIAEKRGGKCLSDTYVNSHTKLLWECKEGHQWKATPHSVKSGTWCQKCAGISKRLNIEEMQEIAKQRGGKCLSDSYVNNSTKLTWECAEKHKWKATPNKIKGGKWCPHCAGIVKRTIEEMRSIAEERGGKCLSNSYVNNSTKLLWECAEKHQWEAAPYNIKSGTWCPECSSGLGERICREFFEQIFGKKFPKSYPKWLVNKKGNQMELDGYCQSMALAFEHHGEQHYSDKTYFTKIGKSLRMIKEDDRLKRKLCAKQGIVLIEIPEIPNLLSIKEVKAFIKKECEVNGILLPSNFGTKEINIKKAYATSGAKVALKELQRIAKEYKGKCLSSNYITARTKLLWECEEKHQWKATPNAIKSGQWCPHCAGNVKGTIKEMKERAKKRNGKCLSSNYITARTKLLWECAEKHQWEAAPCNIKSGKWCPHCAGIAKGTIEEMQSIAVEHGGKCMSELYVNDHTNLLWECAEGHQWKAIPRSVKRDSWCPHCAGNVKGTIKEMRSFAEERGGKCLSSTYVNSSTKLLWECKEGHQWEATPNNVKRGSWCRLCRSSKARGKNNRNLSI